MKNTCSNDLNICKTRVTGIKDTMQLLSGKWKVHILGTLMFNGKMRFMDLRREVDGIAAKMLSKELQDLQLNRLVKRTVMQTRPITVDSIWENTRTYYQRNSQLGNSIS